MSKRHLLNQGEPQSNRFCLFACTVCGQCHRNFQSEVVMSVQNNLVYKYRTKKYQKVRYKLNKM